MTSPAADRVMQQSSEAERLLRERDLLLQLLELSSREDVELLLKGALTLLITVAGARRGCIELRGVEDAQTPQFRLVHEMNSDELAEGSFSQTVMAEALATGETVLTASAVTDPRFSQSRSVRAQRLEAVLCVPMGGTPPIGIVYLQDRLQLGPFSDEDLRRTQLFARHVGQVADRLLWRSSQRTAADPTLEFRAKLAVTGVVGTSPALAAVFQQMAAVAPMNVGVLFTGESGTGKTQFARALHDSSLRAGRNFIEINCAALPEELFESELFGAVAGAHSTAVKRISGKLDAADGGTLFLDEVAELSLRAQAKLLQVLQSGTYFPLGSSTPRHANIRVIAATNADLGAAVKTRTFRDDLFFRLNVFPIRVPSLVERRSDIAALAQYFVQSTCQQNDLRPLTLSEGALMALQYRDWPGNVRELSHAVQAAVLRAQSQASVMIERSHVMATVSGASASQSAPPARPTFHTATRDFQAALLRDTLQREQWNVTAAARALELTRAHVYNLIAAFELERPASSL